MHNIVFKFCMILKIWDNLHFLNKIHKMAVSENVFLILNLSFITKSNWASAWQNLQ